MGMFRTQWTVAVLFTAAMWWFLPEGRALFIGILAGSWFKDIVYIRTLQDQFPIMKEVIDWQRVDAFLTPRQ
jgi:hypothetical protein